MSNDELSHFADALRSTQKALSTKVWITHEQVSVIVVRELIERRNNGQCKPEFMDAFDTILKGYFLDAEEFDRYVVNQEPIEDE